MGLQVYWFQIITSGWARLSIRFLLIFSFYDFNNLRGFGKCSSYSSIYLGKLLLNYQVSKTGKVLMLVIWIRYDQFHWRSYLVKGSQGIIRMLCDGKGYTIGQAKREMIARLCQEDWKEKMERRPGGNWRTLWTEFLKGPWDLNSVNLFVPL